MRLPASSPVHGALQAGVADRLRILTSWRRPAAGGSQAIEYVGKGIPFVGDGIPTAS